MIKPIKIYLATPYSHRDEMVRLARFHAVNRKAAELMSRGYVVFSPISHSHPIANYIPREYVNSWEFWKAQDMPLLEWADELWVMDVTGWKESTGVTAEVARAMEMGMPVIFTRLEDD